jgi:hypothetical protein
MVEVVGAFGAFGGVDDEGITLHPDGRIGALKLTGAAASALRGDDFVGHEKLLSASCQLGLAPFKRNIETRLP